MRIRTIVFALLIGVSTAFGAVNCAAIGQNGWAPPHIPEECYPAQTFEFAGLQNPREMQETVTILRTVMDFVQVSVDASASTVTLRGSPEKLAMTAWLLRQLDQPVPKTAATRKEQYLVPAALDKELGAGARGQQGNDGVLSVFFLAHTENGRGVQQLLTVLRTVGDVQMVFNDTARTAIVVRCPAPQMALAEYMISVLDIAPETTATAPELRYKSREGTDDLVRVFYLQPVMASATNQQIMIALHDVVDIKKVFNSFSPEALVVRGSADQIAAADWLIKSLQPKSSSGASEFRFTGTDRPDNVMRVFYQPHAKVDTMKSLAFDSPAALLVRGSASQVAAAEQVMQ